MLGMKNLDDRSFEERLNEAINQAPLYTKDWTNFNPSDPGVTVLENLTAFNTLQQSKMNAISQQVHSRLLAMCGFHAGKSRTARVLLKPENMNELKILPANYQFHIGNLTFETNRVTNVLPYEITGVYSYYKEKWHDYSYLCQSDVDINARVFGSEPQAGSVIYFMTNGMPAPGEEWISHVTVTSRHNRNPFEKKGNNMFAEILWEIYTEEGFVEAAVKDMTGCFLVSGELRVRMPNVPAAVYDKLPEELQTQGYCLRATLKKANYDVCPKVVLMNGFLFEVWQKKTLAQAVTYQNTSQIRIFSDLAEEGQLQVFVKEEKGGSYHRYEPAYMSGYEGRFYDIEKQGPGMFEIRFDKEQYGFAPAKVKNAVKVLIYTEEAMRGYRIGEVLGYDNQELQLANRNIVADSFRIIARRLDAQGDYIYDFVHPERYEEDALTYHLYEADGRIVIEDAGDYIGAELFVAALAVFDGPAGNIRANAVFETEEGRFTNPGPGTGGCYRETTAALRKRFLEDVRTPYTAVTESDYEYLVKKVPNLCIDKVRAYERIDRNLVQIVIKPGTDEEFPVLSQAYLDEIKEYVNEHRLLTTQIEIVQPQYVPVHVYGTIYVKRHYENCREQIERVIRERLDYRFNDKNFGETLHFEEIFQVINDLECVDMIYDITLRSGDMLRAKQMDSDIVVAENVLCYPGEIVLDIGAYNR